MFFLYKEFLLYILKCKWNGENEYLLTNDNKKYLLQCKVKYKDETINI